MNNTEAETVDVTQADILAARNFEAQRDPNKAYQYLDGSRDDYPGMRATVQAFARHRTSQPSSALREPVHEYRNRVAEALNANTTPDSGQAAVGGRRAPCEGSVADNRQAVHGMQWCLYSGRYCYQAPSGKCRGGHFAASPTPSDTDSVREAIEALQQWVSQATVWLNAREEHARPGWMQPAIDKSRAALAKLTEEAKS